MTIICGYKSPEGRGVWIGADSRISNKSFLFPEHANKLLRAGKWWIGVAGKSDCYEMIADLAVEISELNTPRDVSLMLTAEFKAREYKNINEGCGPPEYGQALLLASSDGVWGISENGVVVTPAWGFWAIGSGEDFALGAAHVAHRMERPGECVVRAALEAACEFDATCGGELTVERVG